MYHKTYFQNKLCFKMNSLHILACYFTRLQTVSKEKENQASFKNDFKDGVELTSAELSFFNDREI